MSKNLANNNAKSNQVASDLTKGGKCNLKGSQKLRPHRVGKGIRRALIVENMQNCFFQGGSVGFRDKGNEKALLKKVNKLISLHEIDENYKKAGTTGKEKTNMLGQLKSGTDTGARKKFFFDTIIFTQDGNPPDHWTFASHHFLRNPEEFDYFSSSTKGKKKTYKCKGVRCKGKTKRLLPDHALTDGTDRYKMDGKERIGIEFHPKLDVRSLYRPNSQFHPTTFIKKPIYKNRGFIVFKGNALGDSRSAFKNSLDKKTGLEDFLRCNKINSIFVCGMGRENAVKNTLLDSNSLKFIKERILVYDATLPIGLDIVDDKSVYKSTLKNNNFVKNLSENKITVIPMGNISGNITGGITIHDREEPSGILAKRIANMDNLFSTGVKK